MQDLLPIGSVVVLKEGTKKLMIIGRLQQNVKTKKLYDYAGCPWPEGYMDKEHCYVFNHDDIDLLYYLGMQDVEEFNFRFKLDEMMEISMAKENTTTNKATVKQAEQVMENQLEIPDFNFGQPVKEQPEVNVQVIFEKGGISKDEKDDLFIMYSFAIIITVLNFILLYKQVW